MVSGHRPYWAPWLWSSLWFSLQPCHTSQELSLDFSNQRRSASPTYLEILVSLRNCLGVCFDKERGSKCKLKLTNPESAQTQVWHAGLLLNVTWNKKSWRLINIKIPTLSMQIPSDPGKTSRTETCGFNFFFQQAPSFRGCQVKVFPLRRDFHMMTRASPGKQKWTYYQQNSSMVKTWLHVQNSL